MKLCLFDCGAHDGTVARQITNHMGLTFDSPDAYVVPVAYRPDFKFSGSEFLSRKPYILLDFLEFGWNAGDQENRIGHGIDRPWFAHMDSCEWGNLDGFVRDNPPALTFKRELFERDRSDTLVPIEWLCDHVIPPIVSKEQFDSRPFDVFYNWGYSNPSRVHLHAEIFRAMADRGIDVLSEFRQLESYPISDQHRWVSIFSPWWMRTHLQAVLDFQQKSKVSVAMPGAGIKTFRDSEAPIGAIMAKPDDNLAWSYPWIHQQNCIRMEEGRHFDDIRTTLNYALINLYDIYVEGQRNLANYQCETYVKNYILPKIEAVL